MRRIVKHERTADGFLTVLYDTDAIGADMHVHDYDALLPDGRVVAGTRHSCTFQSKFALTVVVVDHGKLCVMGLDTEVYFCPHCGAVSPQLVEHPPYPQPAPIPPQGDDDTHRVGDELSLYGVHAFAVFEDGDEKPSAIVPHHSDALALKRVDPGLSIAPVRIARMTWRR